MGDRNLFLNFALLIKGSVVRACSRWSSVTWAISQRKNDECMAVARFNDHPDGGPRTAARWSGGMGR